MTEEYRPRDFAQLPVSVNEGAQPPSSEPMRAVFPHATAFAANARFYAPPSLLQTLRGVARVPDLALVIDIDATNLDRVTVAAIEALARVNVVPVLVGDGSDHRPQWAQDALGSAASLDKRRGWRVVVAQARGPSTERRLVVITDQHAVRSALDDRDRMILTSDVPHMVGAEIALPKSALLRAALWWLVHERATNVI